MRHQWIALLLAVSMVGCAWKGLDDLAEKTPVRVYEKSKKFNSPTFGAELLVLNRPDDSRLPTIVVGGQYTTPAVAMEIGLSGNVDHTRIARVETNEIAPNQDRRGNTIQAIVELSPVGDDARVLVAVPEDDYVRWVRIPPVDAPDPNLIAGGMYHVENLSGPGAGISGFGGAVAAGFFDASDGEQEWAIADDNNIFIAMNEPDDASNFVKCYLPGPNISDYSSVTRALVSGRFHENDTTDTFVAGLPDPDNAYGSVRFITWVGTVDCNGVLLPPVEIGRSEEYFGTALAAADLNGDGVDDLIVGSPNKKDVTGTDSRVYVYLTTGSPATLDASAPAYIITSPMLHFGSSVAAVDVTGDGVPEIVVGDPQAAFGSNHGQAYIFQQTWAHNNTSGPLTPEDGVLIGDTAEPTKMFGSDLKETSRSFGISLAGLAWEPGSDRRELIVGSAGAIFAFYLTGLVDDDDRKAPDHDPRD